MAASQLRISQARFSVCRSYIILCKLYTTAVSWLRISWSLSDWQDVWFLGQHGNLLWMNRCVHPPSSIDVWVEGKYSCSRSIHPAAKSVIRIMDFYFPHGLSTTAFCSCCASNIVFVCKSLFKCTMNGGALCFKKNKEDYTWNKPAHFKLVGTLKTSFPFDSRFLEPSALNYTDIAVAS